MPVGRKILGFAGLSASEPGQIGVNFDVPVSRPLRTFGRVLQDAREAKGRAWTQKYVAKQAGLNHFSVSKAETDKPKITVDTYGKICRVLGTTIEAIVADMDPQAALPESIRAFLGQAATDGNSAVRSSNRTRYTQATPIASEATIPGEADADMQNDPELATLLTYWRRLELNQRDELVLTAIRLHRDQRSGKAGG